MLARPVNRPRRTGARNGARPALPALALLLALLPLPAHGDEIILRHGGTIVGRVLAENDRELVIEVPYGRMTIPRREVVEIVRESEAEFLRDASDRILRAGDVVPALDLLRRAVALAPEDGLRRSSLIAALDRAIGVWIEEKRLEDAETLIDERRALGADPAPEREWRESIAAIRRSRADRERRAALAWEEGAFETAHRLWSELRAAHPPDAERWRRPLAAAALRLGHDALLGRRLDTARERYLETLELDPDRIDDVREPLALVEVERARPHLVAGRLDEADRELAAALEILPGEPALLFHRALIAEARGDTRAAGRIYAELAGERHRPIEGHVYLEQLRRRAATRVERGVALAFRDAPVPEPAEGGAELTEAVRAGPFVVRHVAGVDAAEVLRALERELARFEASWFGGRPALPVDLEIEVLLHPSRGALLDVPGAPALPSCDGFVRSERRYGILTRQEMHLNGGAPRLISGVVPHELAHLLLPHRIGQGVVLPPWLEEGIACTEEPEHLRRHRRRTLVDARRAEEVLPLADLIAATEVPAERAEIFYAQAATVVEHLRARLDIEELILFAQRAALAGSEAAIVGIAGYPSVADLELSWRRGLEGR